MLDIGPSDPRRRKGVGEEVRKAWPELKGAWPPNRRRRNSLCRRCSSFNRLLSWACSSEKDERLDRKESKFLFNGFFSWLHSTSLTYLAWMINVLNNMGIVLKELRNWRFVEYFLQKELRCNATEVNWQQLLADKLHISFMKWEIWSLLLGCRSFQFQLLKLGLQQLDLVLQSLLFVLCQRFPLYIKNEASLMTILPLHMEV